MRDLVLKAGVIRHRIDRQESEYIEDIVLANLIYVRLDPGNCMKNCIVQGNIYAYIWWGLNYRVLSYAHETGHFWF